MKAGMFKRYVYQSKVLLSFVALQFATLQAAGDQLSGQYYRKMRRVDVMEVWGGHAEISYQAALQGWSATSPYDLEYGIDLHKPEERAELLEDIARLRPRLVCCEFPCRLWGPMSRFNYSGSQERRRLLRQLRKKEEVFLELTRDIFMAQLQRGDEAFAENPWTSDSRSTRPIQELVEHESVFEVRTDMCQYGLRHPETGRHMKKDTWLLVTSAEMAVELSRRCSREHPHDACFGGQHITRAAGRYTTAFAQVFFEACGVRSPVRSRLGCADSYGIWSGGLGEIIKEARRRPNCAETCGQSAARQTTRWTEWAWNARRLSPATRLSPSCTLTASSSTFRRRRRACTARSS